VAFKVTLTRSGNKEWSAPYFCTQNIAKPLQGSNSWTENDSAVLKQIIHEDLSELVPVVLKDISSPFPRDESQKILVKGHLPFRRNLFQLIGYKLTEDKDYIVFNSCITDYSCNAGINILHKNSISYRPAKSDDPLCIEFDK
jgi:hypothetical protein